MNFANYLKQWSWGTSHFDGLVHVKHLTHIISRSINIQPAEIIYYWTIIQSCQRMLKRGNTASKPLRFPSRSRFQSIFWCKHLFKMKEPKRWIQEVSVQVKIVEGFEIFFFLYFCFFSFYFGILSF